MFEETAKSLIYSFTSSAVAMFSITIVVLKQFCGAPVNVSPESISNKNTVIQNYTKSLDFKPSETLQPQLIPINTINSISPQQLVSFKAKVTQLTGPKTQRTEKATLQKSSAVWWIPQDTSVLYFGKNGSTVLMKMQPTSLRT